MCSFMILSLQGKTELMKNTDLDMYVDVFLHDPELAGEDCEGADLMKNTDLDM
jgi:hypothetical protein